MIEKLMDKTRTRRLLAVLTVTAVCLAWTCPLRADVDSPALAKYTQPVDRAVTKALEFLARQQNPDGSFKMTSSQNSGVHALAVIAFLAKGHTPGQGPYGEVINKGIDYILAQQHPGTGILIKSGNAHGSMYNHGICTLLLSEVSGMVSPERQKKIDEALPKAIKVILAAQAISKGPRDSGGWRYQASSSDSDISVTGWCLMSLRSCRNNGAPVPNEAIENAVRYVMKCRSRDGGFCYQPGAGPGLARTGVALLCLELCGRHRDQAAVGAGKWIQANLPRTIGHEFFYYALYYCSQGMFQLGGEDWVAWAIHMYEMMLKFQKEDGSWPQGGGNEAVCGPVYSTAMAVLALSVSYRQLPIYQR